MKPILSFLLCCCASVALANPWGASGYYDQPRVRPEESRPQDAAPSTKPGERYLLRQVLEGRPVRVFLEEGEESEETLAEYREKIQKAYNKWFWNTAENIRKTKREREFADILPMLEKGIAVEFVDSGEDIIFAFVDRREIAKLCEVDITADIKVEAGACYVFGGVDKPIIYVPKNPRGRKNFGPFGPGSGAVMFASLVHEIGHSLGFSDQYALARDKDTHRIYRGENTDNTIMNSKKFSLTCDDADGVVNLIDITRQNHRGGTTGWRSLCKKSKAYYVNGAQLGLGPYAISSEEGNAWTVKTYQKGEYKGKETFVPNEKSALSPFVSFQEKVLHRDALKRPVLTQGPRGEKVYYMHLYDSTLRLVTHNGKYLLVEDRMRIKEKGKTLATHSVWFYVNGRPAFLETAKSGQKGKANYFEGANGELVQLEIRFDKKNRLTIWGGSEVENPTFPFMNNGAARTALSAKEETLSDKITEQVNKRYGSAQKQRLAEQVERWFLEDGK